MAFASCQNSSTTDKQAPAADSTTIQTEQPNAQPVCYIRANGQDTTFVNLTIAANGTVTGTYDWTPWEQDGAHGTVTGKKEGEMISLMYDYTIEGSNQQQEMLLKMTGDQLAEADGELVEAGGGALKLKDPSNVKFLTFTKVTCR